MGSWHGYILQGNMKVSHLEAVRKSVLLDGELMIVRVEWRRGRTDREMLMAAPGTC